MKVRFATVLMLIAFEAFAQSKADVESKAKPFSIDTATELSARSAQLSGGRQLFVYGNPLLLWERDESGKQRVNMPEPELRQVCQDLGRRDELLAVRDRIQRRAREIGANGDVDPYKAHEQAVREYNEEKRLEARRHLLAHGLTGIPGLRGAPAHLPVAADRAAELDRVIARIMEDQFVKQQEQNEIFIYVTEAATLAANGQLPEATAGGDDKVIKDVADALAKGKYVEAIVRVLIQPSEVSTDSELNRDERIKQSQKKQ